MFSKWLKKMSLSFVNLMCWRERGITSGGSRYSNALNIASVQVDQEVDYLKICCPRAIHNLPTPSLTNCAGLPWYHCSAGHCQQSGRHWHNPNGGGSFFVTVYTRGIFCLREILQQKAIQTHESLWATQDLNP
jgi:hypothetical protein